MGFALFGLAHLLTNRLTADWIFLGGSILFGYFGSVHQDSRKMKQIGNELRSFVDRTSILPFWTILRRVQQLKFGEISKRGIVLGFFATVIARLLHPSILDRLF